MHNADDCFIAKENLHKKNITKPNTSLAEVREILAAELNRNWIQPVCLDSVPNYKGTELGFLGLDIANFAHVPDPKVCRCVRLSVSMFETSARPVSPMYI